MWNHLFSQTGKIVRFMIRRDWIRISTWLFLILLLTMITAVSFTDLYQNEQERQAIAETMRNPAMTAMVGPGYGLDEYTTGPMLAHQMLLFTAIIVAIMSILLVVRHTRLDEEEGRIELIRSLPVGRLSNVSAAMIVLFSTNILLSLIIGFGLYSLQIEGLYLFDSLLYGAALGVTGIFFSAVAALFAQLAENSRGAIGYTFAVLGGAYVIRAIGDVNVETLSWLSPLGWVLKTEVYVNNYWWPLLLKLAGAIIIVGITLYLHALRDLGSGILPAKPGKKHASRMLKNPFGLAFRLQRTGIIAWALGMFVLGASYGSVFGDLEDFFLNNELLSQMLAPIEGLTLTEQFLTMLMSVIAMICTVPSLMFMLKLKGEETKGRIDHLLVRTISRIKLMGSYLALSVISGVVMLILAVFGLWLATSTVMDEPLSFILLVESAIVYLPAIWLMINLTVLLIGFFPRLTNVIWLYLGYSFLVVYLGGLLQFPEWMGNLSPYGHVPQVPVEESNFVSLSILICLSIAAMILGLFSYKKRDLLS
ncbi:ABC transporter permease [Halalkalibacter krulwichiae]|uniref:ABC-2 family transporter protein n=1 Tax=Halalkalibacter krulwichiae TaxID=199441 RepID=A0A1X9MAW0_9BACI|nr:ABC transporter permease [Halalkalibacter krulwichiae]ARK30589.1 ABC-2 family transporter protein [Halalkalibacter krulwichiae]